ncbi:monothiol glutaredoxin-s15 [Anaeramoeba ignava]|uniref:Monothiol glutaredoxin-s15 n=1 Tax=Anaeramoeba ignava TaxID=1746090 RepID=A0A9Q0R9M3_ANAIG|nr:monothiol glutaredoxin-s15 [Anaeramoeba ignava]
MLPQFISITNSKFQLPKQTFQLFKQFSSIPISGKSHPDFLPKIKSPDSPEAKKILARINKIIKQNPVVLFLKGTQKTPGHGYNRAFVQVLNLEKAKFLGIDVSEDSEALDGVRAITKIDEIPQLFIGGKFVGVGKDVLDKYRTGDLEDLLIESGAEFVD